MSKRKPPKNLRPYATPSGKKTAFVDVQQPEAGELMTANIRGDIAAPHIVFSSSDTFTGKCVSVRVKTDELCKWRKSRTVTATAHTGDVAGFANVAQTGFPVTSGAAHE